MVYQAFRTSYLMASSFDFCGLGLMYFVYGYLFIYVNFLLYTVHIFLTDQLHFLLFFLTCNFPFCCKRYNCQQQHTQISQENSFKYHWILSKCPLWFVLKKTTTVEATSNQHQQLRLQSICSSNTITRPTKSNFNIACSNNTFT